MPVELDSQEVLEHLYSLGYYNITKDQLKEFVKDLKKLIKYDLRNQERKYQQNLQKSNKENDHHITPTNDRSSPQKIFTSIASNTCPKKNSLCCSCFNPPQATVKSSSKSDTLGQVKVTHDSSIIDPTLRPICSNCHHPIDTKQFHPTLFPSQVAEDESDAASTSEDCCTDSNRQSNKKKIKENVSSIKKQASSLKPCPSFIRPNTVKGKPPKADPVALYHYYKSLWDQHTLPGENSHEDLRWRIRHKMMAPPESKCHCTLIDDTNSCKMWKSVHKKKNNKSNEEKSNECILIKRICKKCRGESCENCALKILESLEVLVKGQIEEKVNKKPEWVSS